MANLYDKASLVLPTSPAYKDGAIQAYKPLTSQGTFDFTRGSNLAATRVDANGLIEKGYANQSHYSNNFTPSHWVKASANITANQQGYDGSNDAWLLTENSATSSHGVYDGTFVNGTGVQTHSMYLKSSGRDAQMRVFGIGSGQAYANFNLTSGTIGNSGGAILIDSNIENVGNGWYRCSITLNPTSAQGIGVYIIPNDTHPEAGSYTGDSTSGLYIQDTQVNSGLVALPYVETASTTDAQAGILEDMPRLDYSGGASCPSLLLEPQRGNNVPYSEYFEVWDKTGTVTITSNYGISPEGVKNSTRIQFSGASNELRDVTSVSAGNVSTIYIKGTSGETIKFGSNGSEALFTLNGEWQRIEQYNAGAATKITLNTYSGATARDVEVWGAMQEFGSYPTSYIPTYGSSVTRLADGSSLISAGDLLGETQGTIFIEVGEVHNDSTTGATKWFMEIRKDQNNSFGIGSGGADSAPTIRFVTNIAGSVSTDAEPAGFSNSKIAIRYTAVDFKIYQNGVLQSTIAKSIGGYVDIQFLEGAGDDLSMPIKQFSAFPTALTDAECIALTTLE